jgi:HSP20 family protein
MFGYGRLDWNGGPWRELRRLQRDMNRLFGGSSGWTAREYPSVNLWRDGQDVVLTAEVPGVEAEDLDISVQDNSLTLRGIRRAVALAEDETYHRQERGSGDFVRTVQLPFEVDADKVQAQLEKGILRLTLPRAEIDKPKKIAVRTG